MPSSDAKGQGSNSIAEKKKRGEGPRAVVSLGALGKGGLPGVWAYKTLSLGSPTDIHVPPQYIVHPRGGTG